MGADWLLMQTGHGSQGTRPPAPLQPSKQDVIAILTNTILELELGRFPSNFIICSVTRLTIQIPAIPPNDLVMLDKVLNLSEYLTQL